MSYLVDTHIFLWTLFSPNKISKKVKSLLLDPENTKIVSIISFWEISLKYQLGKINLTGVLPDKLPELSKEAGFDILNLEPEVISSFYKLPKIKNKDPFDRMLAWQAIHKDFYLITKDPDFMDYDLKTVW